MKIRNLIIAGVIAGSAFAALAAHGEAIRKTCVPGNADYQAGTGLCTTTNFKSSPEGKAKAAAEKAKADAELAERVAKGQALLAKHQAERDAKRKAAEAKFKAEGWWEQQPGIYVRWCTETCNNSKVIGDNRYSLMEVWAKDANAGDIYAQVNLFKDGVVVGWTNDTMYLSQGQRGVLTFDSYQYFDKAQLVKFNARG